MEERSQVLAGAPSSLRKQEGMTEQIIGAVTGALSRVFRTSRVRTIIVGVNPCTRLLTYELQIARKAVSLIELSDIEDLELLERCGAENARCLVAASPEDSRNLSLCRTAHATFGVPVTVARLRLLEGVTSWARVNDSGMARSSWQDLIQAINPDGAPTFALSRLARTDEHEQIAEIDLRSPLFIGRTIEDLPMGRFDVVALTRQEIQIAAYGDADLEMGDVITVIGEKTAIGRLRESLASL
jgi:Trk K+ transport system NAD-binding subunit